MNCVFTNRSYIIILPVPNFQDTYNILQPQRVHMLYVPFILYIYVICVNLFGSSPKKAGFGHTFLPGAENSHRTSSCLAFHGPVFFLPNSGRSGAFLPVKRVLGHWGGELEEGTNLCTKHSYRYASDPKELYNLLYSNTYGEWLLICLFQVEMERINSAWLTPKKEPAAVASPEGFVWCCKIQGVCSTRSPAVGRTYSY